MSLVKGEVHLLNDSLFRVLHVLANNLELSQTEHTVHIDLSDGMMYAHREDQFFALFLRSLLGQLPETSVQKNGILFLLASFKADRSLLRYQ